MNIQMIPLNKLIQSLANVRKTGTADGIEELAASITAHGLLQNLAVRPGPKGKFEVVAGSRRLTALNLLVKRKALAKDAEIACNLIDGESAEEISLAENVIRLPMHPADQYEAFKALSDAGQSADDIAARFGTSPATVRQRLKLASVSPRLFGIYREGGMNLETLMAFTVSDDHPAQEAAWDRLASFNRHPSTIREILTAAHVRADDKRVRFVGCDAYLAAGGGIIRDLFEDEHEGYLTDPALLDRLVAEGLEEAAVAVRAEGWKWVEIAPALASDFAFSFGRVHPVYEPPTEAEQQELDRLTAEYDALVEEHGDDPEPDIAEQIELLSERIDELNEGKAIWQPDDKATAGAIVTTKWNGEIEIVRGLIKPGDKPKQRPNGSDAGGLAALAVKPVAANNGLSFSLIEDLTAHRTAALRAELAKRPNIALAAIVHALALPVFYDERYRVDSCLDLKLENLDLTRSAEGIKESKAVIFLAAREEEWTEALPRDAADLFGWLTGQETAALLDLLAYCAATRIDAVRTKQDRADEPRLVHADRLASTLGLDMATWWEPTRESYFGRVSKKLALEAIAEGTYQSAASGLAECKKETVVKEAEKRLKGTGWLPQALRLPRPEIPANGAETEAGESASALSGEGEAGAEPMASAA
jgi:ParB family chromosome partitioning protein